MRQKKVRGNLKIHRRILRWNAHTIHLDLNYLEEHKRDYVKIRISPFSDLSLINSMVRHPRGKNRTAILASLLEIYDHWKKTLDSIQKPYYLKIWLFEPRFLQSQVVCAIDDYIDFYKNTFSYPEIKKQLDFSKFGKLSEQLSEFTWEHCLDEDIHFDEIKDDYKSDEDYYEMKAWFVRLLKKKHQVKKISNTDSKYKEAYIFKRGNVWLGEKK